MFFCVLHLRQTDLEHWAVLAFCTDLDISECMVIPLWMLAFQHVLFLIMHILPVYRLFSYLFD